MSSSPRRPVPDPLIIRQYEPSRLQNHSMTCAFERLIPIISRRLGSPRTRPGDPAGANARDGERRPSVAGA
jgi:hypothetical protein